jgi:hypothetical protein
MLLAAISGELLLNNTSWRSSGELIVPSESDELELEFEIDASDEKSHVTPYFKQRVHSGFVSSH